MNFDIWKRKTNKQTCLLLLYQPTAEINERVEIYVSYREKWTLDSVKNKKSENEMIYTIFKFC